MPKLLERVELSEDEKVIVNEIVSGTKLNLIKKKYNVSSSKIYTLMFRSKINYADLRKERYLKKKK